MVTYGQLDITQPCLPVVRVTSVSSKKQRHDVSGHCEGSSCHGYRFILIMMILVVVLMVVVVMVVMVVIAVVAVVTVLASEVVVVKL